MNTDTPSAIEATDALEATQDQAPAAPSPEKYAIVLTAQNLALSEALARLTAAIRDGQDTAPLLVLADQAIAGSMREPNGSPDFTILANVLGGHAGHLVVNAANRAFEQALHDELARALPTVKSIEADSEMEHGDEGDYFASFSSVTVWFKSGGSENFSRNFDEDDEFALGDDDSLLRHDDDAVEDDPGLKAERDANVAKYAKLFGVKADREVVLGCLDLISEYLGSYYWHNHRQGGTDHVYEA